MNQRIYLRNLIYVLKTNYGLPVKLQRDTVTNTDLETGIKTITKSCIDVRKGIVLETKESLYQLRGFIGGNIDKNTRVVIIDIKDIPANYVINSQDYIVYNHKRYEINVVSSFDPRLAYILTLKATEGIQTGEVFNLRASNMLTPTQGAINAS